MKVLAIDVGLILGNFESSEDNSPSVDERFKDIFAGFIKARWFIVLVTANDSNVKENEVALKKAGLGGYINDYTPVNKQPNDSKIAQLEKYKLFYELQSSEDIYFYVGESDIFTTAVTRGFKNSCWVCGPGNLVSQLRVLAETHKIPLKNKYENFGGLEFGGTEKDRLMSVNSDAAPTTCHGCTLV